MCETVDAVLKTFAYFAAVCVLVVFVLVAWIVSQEMKDRKDADLYEERAAAEERRREAAKAWRAGGRRRVW